MKVYLVQKYLKYFRDDSELEIEVFSNLESSRKYLENLYNNILENLDISEKELKENNFSYFEKNENRFSFDIEEECSVYCGIIEKEILE